MSAIRSRRSYCALTVWPGYFRDAMQAIEHTKTLEEPVYTPDELARLRKLHPSTVRKMFIDEEGVIRIGHKGLRGRRQYFTLRIPATVAERVFSRMTVRAGAR